MASASAMSSAICKGQWQYCLELLKNDPTHAEAFAAKPGTLAVGPLTFKNIQGLPLHEAVAVGAPIQVVDALARSFPAALGRKELVLKRFPLHVACARADQVDEDAVLLLSKYYAKGLEHADKSGKTPLHYVMEKKNTSEKLLACLLKLRPNIAKAQDKRGVIPLHLACARGASTSLIKMLLELHPDGVVIMNLAGKNALELCHRTNAPNMEEVSRMLAATKQQVDAKFRLASQPSSRRLLV